AERAGVRCERGQTAGVFTDDSQAERLVESYAVPTRFCRQKCFDVAELGRREAVDITASGAASVAVDRVDVDPQWSVPRRAAARRQELCDRYEHEDVQQYGDSQATEHARGPKENGGLVNHLRAPEGSAIDHVFGAALRICNRQKKKTRRWERRVRLFLLSEFTVSSMRPGRCS